MKKSRIGIAVAAVLFSICGFISCKPSVIHETVYTYTDPEITEISVFSEPDIVDYAVGTKLDLTGLVIKAKYNNGMTGIITEVYTATPAVNSVLNTLGSVKVKLEYKKFTTSFNVTVYEEDPFKPAELTGISIKKSGVKTNYTKGEQLDLSELIVYAVYDDGETKTVTNYTTEPADKTELTETGVTTVSVTYEGKSETFEINVFNKLPTEFTGISILNGVKKTLYETGEALDLKGLIIGATDGNGDTKVVTNYITEPAAGAILDTAGKINVTVSYLDFTENFEIAVTEQIISESVYLESISVFQKPFKTAYETGDFFDEKGLIISGKYSDGLVALIPETDYVLDLTSGSELDTEGSKTITVTKGSISTTFVITVSKKILYGDITTINVLVAPNNDIEVAKLQVTGGISFTAPAGYESYLWKVNSVTYGNENTFDFTTDGLIPGVYSVILIAKDSSGNYRSSTSFVKVAE
ncbi:MAG: bacterial Ig-like domain-containing protein [Treponema sp.]|nr:bacterial Ig-like domain-containing protein [Treponema sp.]